MFQKTLLVHRNLGRTCSVRSPCRGTSDRRKYGFDTEQVIYPRTFTGHYQRSNMYTQEIIEQYEVKERPGNYLNLKFGLSIRLGKK